jgi:hypothetical protein
MALTWSAKVLKTLAVWPNPKMVVMIMGFGVRNLFRAWFGVTIMGFGVRNLFRAWFGVRNLFRAWSPKFIPPDTE